MDVLTYLQGQGRHSIDVLLAIYTLTQQTKKEGNTELGWKEINQWIQKNLNTTLSDSTYRARRQELEALGLVELSPIDKLRSTVKLTPKGAKYATVVIEFLEKIKKTSEDEK